MVVTYQHLRTELASLENTALPAQISHLLDAQRDERGRGDRQDWRYLHSARQTDLDRFTQYAIPQLNGIT